MISNKQRERPIRTQTKRFFRDLRKEVFPIKSATIMMVALLLSACVTGNQGIFGFGPQVSQVSNLIYKVEVNGFATQSIEEVRDIAILEASEKTIESGYTRFRIIGGDGFKKVRRTLHAGPIFLPIANEPRGNITVKFLTIEEASDADTYIAAYEVQRLSALVNPKNS